MTTIHQKSFDRQVRVARGDTRHVNFVQVHDNRFVVKIEGFRAKIRIHQTNRQEDLDLGLKWVARTGDIEVFGKTAKGAFTRFCKTVFKR